MLTGFNTDTDRPQKRRRNDYRSDDAGRDGSERRREVADRLKRLIERLGEQSRKPIQDNIHEMAGVLLKDMVEFDEVIIETIVDW